MTAPGKTETLDTSMRLANRLATRPRREAGISLIEVLVVLVVLLIGILSLVRLFPPGFLVNKRQEEATQMTRLASSLADIYKNNAAGLPEAIVAVKAIPNGNSPTGYSWQVDPSVTPDDLGEVETDPDNLGVDPYFLSNVNQIRRIIGERVRIPVASPLGSSQRGSVYLLASGPIVDLPSFENGTESLFVYGASLNRQPVPPGGDPADYLFRPSHYAVDYENGQIAFFVEQGFDRQFLVTYSYYDSSNQVQTVIDEVVNVTAGNDNWIPLAVPGGRPLVPDSDMAFRKFRRLQMGDPWSFELQPPRNDPYEFKVLTPTVGGFANLGVLIFNPAGRDHSEYSGGQRVPLTARIDYDALDWHIVREDRPMPQEAPFEVRLALKDLKKMGDFEADQTPYSGVWRAATAPQVDMVVVDTTSGAEIPAIDPGTNLPNFVVNHKDGVVTFTDAFGQANRNATLRFLYKAHGDWGVQAQKACENYRRRATADLAFNTFYLGGGANGGSATKVYFLPTEAGKTVSLREYVYRNAAGALVRVGEGTYRINSDRGQFEDLGFGPLTWIDIRSKHNDTQPGGGWPLNEPVQPVTGIHGLSFKVRVIVNSGATAEETASGNRFRIRWRKFDLDTFLTRQ